MNEDNRQRPVLLKLPELTDLPRPPLGALRFILLGLLLLIGAVSSYFQLAPWIILAPGLFLAITVLAINLLGDGLRDMLDPRFARRL